MVFIKKLKTIKSKNYLYTGLTSYFLGFIFLFFMGQDYTGIWGFLAPFSIILGIILISVGLIK